MFSTRSEIIAHSIRGFCAELNRPVVVGGSGPSLRSIDYSRVPDDAKFVRVGVFPAEDKYYLGKRVDVAHYAGMPQAAQLVLTTFLTAHVRGDYQILNYMCASDGTQKVGERLAAWDIREILMNEPALSQFFALAGLQSVVPTSGVVSIMAMAALGARDIRVAGIDLYGGDARYGLGGEDFTRNASTEPHRDGYCKGHSRAQDLAALNLVASLPGMRLRAVSPSSPFAGIFGLADVVDNPLAGPLEKAEGTIKDWIRPPQQSRWQKRLLKWDRRYLGGTMARRGWLAF